MVHPWILKTKILQTKKENKNGQLCSTHIKELAKDQYAEGNQEDSIRLHAIFYNENKRDKEALLKQVTASDNKQRVISVMVETTTPDQYGSIYRDS